MNGEEVTAQGGQYGMEETLDVVDAVLSLFTAIWEAKTNDGKISIGDILLFITPLTKLPAAFEGAALIPLEVGEMDDEDREELLNFVQSKVTVGNEKAELILNKIFETLSSGVQLYNAISMP